MAIKQLTVFVENKKGSVASVTKLLSKENVNIRALSIADTTDFGVLRMIVSDPALAKKVLNDAGVVVKTTDVIAVSMEDKPGGLGAIMNTINDGDITVEYMYAFAGRSETGAMVVVKVNDPERAIALLEKGGFKTI